MRSMRATATTRAEVDEIQDLATPLESPDSLDPLIERVGDARFVLLGEASHGTSDYYRWRADVTRRLITEKGFSFVAVEGDWPDCYEVNRWVKLQWLRDHNEQAGADVGFYGLDVYSLWESLGRVLGYLSENQPDAFDAARRAHRCFHAPDGGPVRSARLPRGSAPSGGTGAVAARVSR